MAPTSQPATIGAPLFRRYYCNGYGYSSDYYNCYSPWDSYGRWILLGCIVIGAFLLFLAFSCITARRRRRAGQNPYPLTGWVGGPPPYQAQHPQQPSPYGNQQSGTAPPVYAPPKDSYYGPGQNNGTPNNAYGAPNTNTHGAGNQGYFGGQQSGIELQAPGNSYQPNRGGEPVYAAPDGPPPRK